MGGGNLNYGWPCKEGPEVKLDFSSCNKTFVDPIYAYDEGCAITLGEVYRPKRCNNDYPTEIIFADGCLKNIQLLIQSKRSLGFGAASNPYQLSQGII